MDLSAGTTAILGHAWLVLVGASSWVYVELMNGAEVYLSGMASFAYLTGIMGLHFSVSEG